MTSASYDLWCNVLRRAAICSGLLAIELQLSSKSKIHKLHVATLLHREHDILWLQVPVDDAVGVQELDCLQCLRSVESHVVGDVFVQFVDLAQQSAPFYVFQLKVEMLFVLKRAEYVDDERALLAGL